GGLAVGARDQRDLATGRKVGQQVRVDHEPELAADDGAVAPAGGSRGRGRAARDRRSELRAQRFLRAHARYVSGPLAERSPTRPPLCPARPATLSGRARPRRPTPAARRSPFPTGDIERQRALTGAGWR